MAVVYIHKTFAEKITFHVKDPFKCEPPIFATSRTQGLFSVKNAV